MAKGAKIKQMPAAHNSAEVLRDLPAPESELLLCNVSSWEQTHLLDIGGAANRCPADPRQDFRFFVTLVNLRFPDSDARADIRFTRWMETRSICRLPMQASTSNCASGYVCKRYGVVVQR